MTRFWETTPLSELIAEQWESLCDRCGWCCLEKTEDPDTGEVTLLGVACPHLDLPACRCEIYAERRERHPRCTRLPKDAAAIRALGWLPETCAYLRLAEGRPLPPWHPLLSGDPEAVHGAGASVRDRAISGKYVHPEDLG